MNPAVFTNLKDGQHTFVLNFMDRAGNGSYIERKFTVDTDNPALVAGSDSFGGQGGVLIEGAPNSGTNKEIVQSFKPLQNGELESVELSFATSGALQQARLTLFIWEKRDGQVISHSKYARNLVWDSPGGDQYKTVTVDYSDMDNKLNLEAGKTYGIALRRESSSRPLVSWELGNNYPPGCLHEDGQDFLSGSCIAGNTAMDGVFKVYAE